MSISVKKRKIVAAREPEFDQEPEFDDEYMSDDDIGDQIDDIADTVEDLQDSMDDIQQDDPSIDIEANIEGHYIAECDRCHGIFIAPIVTSEVKVDKITGTCPLCDHETEQYLNWFISPVSDLEVD